MTSLDPPPQEQPGQQPQQQPVPPGQSPATTNVPGLPPTALQQQASSLNEQYQQGQQAFQASLGPAGGVAQEQRGQLGQTSLSQMAEQMAKSYGLDISRGSVVDEQGNFQQTPDQLATADLSSGDVAARMNYISQAINDQKVRQQQNKATAALQAGLSQVQSRGRGSLAAMQSGFYQSMAQVYTDPNLLPEQQDYSFWIQKDKLDEAASIRDTEGEGGRKDVVSEFHKWQQDQQDERQLQEMKQQSLEGQAAQQSRQTQRSKRRTNVPMRHSFTPLG